MSAESTRKLTEDEKAVVAEEDLALSFAKSLVPDLKKARDFISLKIKIMQCVEVFLRGGI